MKSNRSQLLLKLKMNGTRKAASISTLPELGSSRHGFFASIPSSEEIKKSTHLWLDSLKERRALYNKLGLDALTVRDSSHVQCRRDIYQLSEWLDTRLQEVYTDYKDSPEELFPEVLAVYNSCFKSLVAQITTNCKERGELTKRVWRASGELHKKFLNIRIAQFELAKEQHKTDLVDAQKNNVLTIHNMQNEYNEIQIQCEKLKAELRHFKEALDVKNIREERLTNRFLVVQQHYKSIKKEIFILKEENRMLQTKLLSSPYDVVEDSHGYLVPRSQACIRIKHKTSKYLNEELAKDPVLSDITKVDLSEPISSKIQEFGILYIEAYENSLFSEFDFKDASTETPTVETYNMPQQTNVIDLCGESHGIKKFRKEKVIKKQVSLEKKLEVKLEIEDSPYKPTNVREQARKHTQVKKTILKVKDSLDMELKYENMPHVNILKVLMNNLQDAIKLIRAHPLDSKEFSESEDEDLPNSRKKAFLSTIRNTQINLSSADLTVLHKVKKVSNTQVHKLRKVMFKKMLLKLVSAFYAEVLKEVPTELFSLFVYRLLVKKFIMIRAADNRFEHLLSSCIKYKYIPRVRLFGRFLGLYESFDHSELAFFCECLSALANSPSGKSINNSEDAETPLVPHVRCLELLKASEKYFKDNAMTELKQKLSMLKMGDKTGNNKQVVPIDEFLEFLTDMYQRNRNKSLDFLRILFEASDLNDDGYLQLQEFKLLITHLSDKGFSAGTIKELFEDFSEDFLSEDDTSVQAISLENFAKLNENYNVFNEKTLHAFVQADSDKQAAQFFEEMKDKLDASLGEIYYRMSECEAWQDFLEELSALIELLKSRLISQQKPLVYWLAFRLLDEESKRIFIQEKIKGFLPLISNII